MSTDVQSRTLECSKTIIERLVEFSTSPKLYQQVSQNRDHCRRKYLPKIKGAARKDESRVRDSSYI